MGNIDIPKLKLLSASLYGRYNKLVPVLVVTTILGILISGYSFYQTSRAQKELQAVKKASQGSQNPNGDQVTKIVGEVSKLMKVPEGELPTLATISDISKLKDQPFFQNGKNGNVLLVYNRAGKAILYDPMDKRIVEVAPVSNTNASPSAQIFQAKLALRNGTMSSGLAAKIEAEIKKSIPDINITSKDNAARDTYDKTIVVVLNPAAKDTAQNLAKILNAPIADLPSAEIKPAGIDILVILGKDKT